MPVKAFFDTNILVYLISDESDKADQAEKVVSEDGLTSVQVLNEMTNVARRKLAMSWREVNETINLIQSVCSIEPLTTETNEKGRWIAERYGLSVYDAMIVASALLSGCEILYSEDMHDGLLIEHQLRICNPFAKPDGTCI